MCQKVHLGINRREPDRLLAPYILITEKISYGAGHLDTATYFCTRGEALAGVSQMTIPHGI